MTDTFENKPRAIPERFRASTNMDDKSAYALLQANDVAQKALGERVNSPFSRTSPRDSARSKAHILIKTLEQASIHDPLVDTQNEQLAEAYATTGRYDLAAEMTADEQKKAVFEKYWAAVWADDEMRDTAAHRPHHYVRERLFSVKHNQEMPLLKCNVPGCQFLNVSGNTPHVATNAAAHSQTHQGKTQGMSIQDALAYHKSNVNPNTRNV